jgi:hypothetical protein
MSELDIAWEIPELHATYSADARIQRDLILELKFIGKSLTDFYAFGHSALQVMVDPESEQGRVATRTLLEVASERELDKSVIEDRAREGWHKGLQGDELIAELLSRAYDLAALAVMTAPKEERTCFVIMPFSSPFRDYYRLFYRKSLKLAGYESIRAWEGLTNEHYLQMIYMLLHKCGAALADLTPPAGSDVSNLNVIHEIGINMGVGNVTYMIRQSREFVLPSNLTGLPLITYDPTADDWPEGQARGVSEALREIDGAT